MIHSWSFEDIRVKKKSRFVPIRGIRNPKHNNLLFISTYNDNIITTIFPYNNPINDSFMVIRVKKLRNHIEEQYFIGLQILILNAVGLQILQN